MISSPSAKVIRKYYSNSTADSNDIADTLLGMQYDRVYRNFSTK
jgi:hypothetical protein